MARIPMPVPSNRSVRALALGVLAPIVAALPAFADAEYNVVFTSTWSAETHPVDFPDNPHFSGLIGGTHDAGVTFWMPGALASDGIESMAETGSKTLLREEVEAAITQGTAQHVLSGDGMPVSPGVVPLVFSISEEHSLVTLVTMVAPSPDWFVGVHGLDLHEGGAWADQVVVDLFVYDAGTDSGPTYESPNQDTNPAEPIALLESGPFAVTGYVGTFTFTRLTVDVEPGAPGPSVARLAPIAPNPAAGVANVAFELPETSAVTLDIFDVGGRRVRRLASGTLAAGTHRLAWDGRTTSGALAPAGVYLVRLATSRDAATERVVLTH